MIDKESLKYCELNKDILLEYGFVMDNEIYHYEKSIMNDQFTLIIMIDKNKVIKIDVIECSTKEKFLPFYIQMSTGKIVASIKEEYDCIINKISGDNKYLDLIVKYILNKYGDKLEYLWEKSPTSAIWRNKYNNKWYAVLMEVEKRKLGLNEDGNVKIIDFRLSPLEITQMVDGIKYFRGYHMNKKNWITIKIDGSINIEDIYKLIDVSYQLSLKR